MIDACGSAHPATIPRRFNGPLDSGQGGYSAGVVAGFVDGPAEVSLRRPVPLDRPLAVAREDDGVGAAARRRRPGRRRPAGGAARRRGAGARQRRRRARGDSRYRGERRRPVQPLLRVRPRTRRQLRRLRRRGRRGAASWPRPGHRRTGPPATTATCGPSSSGRRSTAPRRSRRARWRSCAIGDPRPASACASTAGVAGAEHVVVGWPIAVDGRKHHAGGADLLRRRRAAGGRRRALLIAPRRLRRRYSGHRPRRKESHVTSADASSTLTFEPPGPGSWELDAVHFPRPVTRYWAEMHPEPFRRGYARVHALLRDAARRRSRYQYVNGFAYSTMRPGRPRTRSRSASRAPRRCSRRRSGASSCASGTRRSSRRRSRPTASCRRSTPTRSPTRSWSRTSQRCRDHHSEMIYQHMRFTGAAMLPVGDLLAHVGDWTDVPPAELLALMRGAAPVSAGASGELATAHRRDRSTTPTRARCSTPTATPARCSTALRALDGEAGPAVSAYLDLVGYRLLDGFDISGPLRARAARRAAARDPRRRRRRAAHDRRRRRRADRRDPRRRCPRSTAPSSTSCSARRG